jgi:hypothetical protein
VYEYVVHVDFHSFRHDGLSKNHIHHPLKGGRRVRESEKHNGRFEKPFVGDESRLPLIAFSDPYVVESPSDVKFREVLVLLDAVEDLQYQGEGVMVLDRVSIEVAIVLDRA